MGEYCAANFFGAGVDPERGEPYTHVFYLAASAAGATEGFDGLPHMFGACIMGNMGYESIELVELARPFLVWETSAVSDSGGPGKWRGGVAVRQIVQPRDHEMLMGFCATGHTCRPFGLKGGAPGAAADHWIRQHDTGRTVRQLANAGEATVRPGEEWIAVTNGGGGSGDPRERDPEAVRDDVIDGFVSSEAARQIYGVVLRKNGHLPEVDTAATRELRANLGRRDT